MSSFVIYMKCSELHNSYNTANVTFFDVTIYVWPKPLNICHLARIKNEWQVLILNLLVQLSTPNTYNCRTKSIKIDYGRIYMRYCSLYIHILSCICNSNKFINSTFMTFWKNNSKTFYFLVHRSPYNILPC